MLDEQTNSTMQKISNTLFVCKSTHHASRKGHCHFLLNTPQNLSAFLSPSSLFVLVKVLSRMKSLVPQKSVSLEQSRTKSVVNKKPLSVVIIYENRCVKSQQHKNKWASVIKRNSRLSLHLLHASHIGVDSCPLMLL